jgi:molybdopterin/thiamine biosynthesis adenylyltransferase
MNGPNLDSKRLERYSRQIIMEEIGPSGQDALLKSRVLVIGAGGLGCPAIQYLAAAGIGTIGIVDDDVVEMSNLHRQVIHGVGDLGKEKVESAREFIHQINPDVVVETQCARAVPQNIIDLVKRYDFIIDGTDNFESCFLINDACTLLSKPYSYGAVLRFSGRAMTFPAKNESPCYRCVFANAPPMGTVPDCSTAGVIGSVAGVIGSIQATEAIKSVSGIGKLIEGRLIEYNALDMSFEEVRIKRNINCPICGEFPTIKTIEDVEYTGACIAK